jgi:hypothetical protein
VILILILSTIPLFVSLSSLEDGEETESRQLSINLEELARIHGDCIPVSVRFKNGLTSEMSVLLGKLGLRFTLDSASRSHIGQYYLLEGSAVGLLTILDSGLVVEMVPQTFAQFLESPRGISMPEINADDVWNTL